MEKVKKTLSQDTIEITYDFIKSYKGCSKKTIKKYIKAKDLDLAIRVLVKEGKIKKYYQKENDIRYEIIL